MGCARQRLQGRVATQLREGPTETGPARRGRVSATRTGRARTGKTSRVLMQGLSRTFAAVFASRGACRARHLTRTPTLLLRQAQPPTARARHHEPCPRAGGCSACRAQPGSCGALQRERAGVARKPASDVARRRRGVGWPKHPALRSGVCFNSYVSSKGVGAWRVALLSGHLLKMLDWPLRSALPISTGGCCCPDVKPTNPHVNAVVKRCCSHLRPCGVWLQRRRASAMHAPNLTLPPRGRSATGSAGRFPAS